MRPASETERNDLEKIRAKIAAATEEIESIRDAEYTVDEAVSIALGAAKEARKLALYRIRGLSRPGIRDPLQPGDLLLGCMKDAELDQRLRSTFEQIIDDPGLPVADRLPAIDKLEATIRKLLDDEERAVLELEASGLLVDRRTPETALDVQRLLDAWDDEAA